MGWTTQEGAREPPPPTPGGATWLSWPPALVPGQRVHPGRASSHGDQATFRPASAQDADRAQPPA